MNFPGGIDLFKQLHEVRPEVVVGQNHSIYMITSNPEALADFLRLAREEPDKLAAPLRRRHGNSGE
jgi:hypothetical protein